jgi:membrane-associated protein
VFDVQSWLSTGGIALLAAIVFAESGLLVGFFLPGDSLLFVAGFLTSGAGHHVLPALPWTIAVVVVAAVVGDQIGYTIGHRVGPALFHRPRSRLFNAANVERAQSFFERKGPRAIVLARFVPVVRTFTPVVAGVAGMDRRRFLVWNILGAALWGAGVVTLGHYVGDVKAIEHNIDYAAVVIVVASLVPVAIEFLRERRARQGEQAPTSAR